MDTESIVPGGYSKGAPIPWWSKILLKMVFSRLPIPHGRLQKMGVFVNSPRQGSHGRVFDQLLIRFSQFEDITGRKPQSYLEVGAGDSIGRAIVANAYGVKEIWMHDSGRFADENIENYQELCGELKEKGFTPADLSKCSSFEELLEKTGARYLTGGLQDLGKIPDGTIDILISEAVLEHLPLREFERFIAEFRRVLKPSGRAIHAIDFHDHLGGKLNHLRFSRRLWESNFFKNSGFYTNRIPPSKMLQVMNDAGFQTQVERKYVWPHSPMPGSSVHPDLNWTDADLRTCSLLVLCQ